MMGACFSVILFWASLGYSQFEQSLSSIQEQADSIAHALQADPGRRIDQLLLLALDKNQSLENRIQALADLKNLGKAGDATVREKSILGLLQILEQPFPEIQLRVLVGLRELLLEPLPDFQPLDWWNLEEPFVRGVLKQFRTPANSQIELASTRLFYTYLSGRAGRVDLYREVVAEILSSIERDYYYTSSRVSQDEQYFMLRILYVLARQNPTHTDTGQRVKTAFYKISQDASDPSVRSLAQQYRSFLGFI
ncbi:MAG: hypothetical protein HY400_05130 [Elusimicrobia bacterium]|nr:hypothetical protein [Elusimicrobiota bacterium]